MDTAILAPAALLVLWSLIMLFWMAATRLPAAKSLGIDITAKPGGRGPDIDPNMPDKVAWKSHNYTHLMEQPTLFYATVIILALAEAGSGLNLWLAWAYVVLRIIHSIWQATINLVNVRFMLFLASTICLMVMAVNAIWATLF
ncbi:MAPEG family protein [Parasphingorhabdus halotolerans]|uniref:MAPEG family protein n=1 Tax=Parasphingorhabdus halotolerans TaxID=2725558 RepID=A0A6H2DJ00_9SPHN|nr:MAPEG family protein [Parasphingorhabdus halotolerans]QJB68304.1 MAPEG family protein [Parasphingorhabdus halotolerans]